MNTVIVIALLGILAGLWTGVVVLIEIRSDVAKLCGRRDAGDAGNAL